MATRTPTPTAHVWLDEADRAWIDDTNVKVIEVALDKLGYGWTAEQIHTEHGGYLSLAQIHAALSSCYDHKAELDEEIGRQVQEYERLRELGKIP
jgi:hypothetical protein